MTVRELIEQLEQFDNDKEVSILDNSGGVLLEIEDVSMNNLGIVVISN